MTNGKTEKRRQRMTLVMALAIVGGAASTASAVPADAHAATKKASASKKKAPAPAEAAPALSPVGTAPAYVPGKQDSDRPFLLGIKPQIEAASWFRIHQNKGQWVCDAGLTSVPVKANVLAQVNWGKVEASKLRNGKACAANDPEVLIRDARVAGRKEQVFRACSSAPEVVKVIQEVRTACSARAVASASKGRK